MWGNFSELAKKAQEQANASLAQISTPVAAGGLFNLDAMQEEELGSASKTKKVEPNQTPTPAPASVIEREELPVLPPPRKLDHAFTPTQASPRGETKGTLKMDFVRPKPKQEPAVEKKQQYTESPLAQDAAVVAAPKVVTEPHVVTTKSVAVEESPDDKDQLKDEEDGWDAEEEDMFDMYDDGDDDEEEDAVEDAAMHPETEQEKTTTDKVAAAEKEEDTMMDLGSDQTDAITDKGAVAGKQGAGFPGMDQAEATTDKGTVSEKAEDTAVDQECTGAKEEEAKAAIPGMDQAEATTDKTTRAEKEEEQDSQPTTIATTAGKLADAQVVQEGTASPEKDVETCMGDHAASANLQNAVKLESVRDEADAAVPAIKSPPAENDTESKQTTLEETEQLKTEQNDLVTEEASMTEDSKTNALASTDRAAPGEVYIAQAFEEQSELPAQPETSPSHTVQQTTNGSSNSQAMLAQADVAAAEEMSSKQTAEESYTNQRKLSPKHHILEDFQHEVEEMESALETEAHETKITPQPVVSEDLKSAPVLSAAEDEESNEKREQDNEAIFEQFTSQIQRLEENHQLELEEIKARYERALEEARDTAAKNGKKEQEELNRQIKLRDEKLANLLRIKEGMGLKMDVLKREVEGYTKLLEERESSMDQADATHTTKMRSLEEKHKQRELEVGNKNQEIRKLKEEMAKLQAELDASNDAYAQLKSRVKVVATELKERRIECRHLSNSVTELTEANQSLQTQVSNLEFQLTQQSRHQEAKDDEVEELTKEVERMQKEIEKAHVAVKERSTIGEKSLSSYKSKAQKALAEANARAAAANEAREEAEIEANAAKAAAKKQLEQAKAMEEEAVQAKAEADARVKTAEDETMAHRDEYEEAKTSLIRMENEIEGLKVQMAEVEQEREKLIVDFNSVRDNLEGERLKSSGFEQELLNERQVSKSLQDQVETLRRELQLKASALLQHDSANQKKESEHSTVLSFGGRKEGKSEAERTIVILQEELQSANEVIQELKEALKGALENAASTAANQSMDHSETSSRHQVADKSTDGATPLFYAMEKQVELNTARDEITRLASLLGDAESAKMEAYDLMAAMKTKMEEAEAKLRRYEKLGRASAVEPPRPQNGYARQGMSSVRQDSLRASEPTSSAVNIEYLKNVMLSFLAAKTVNERKALLPVVSAVLCLTDTEHDRAVKSLEESSELQGVGLTLFESLESKVKGLM